MPVAVIYTRVSTEDQAKKGFSLPEQLSECRAKARELGATEILEYSDDVSGEILDRPGLTEARDVIRRGGVRWFVCLTADRFARKLAHQLMVADEIRRRDVDLVFTQQGYDDTPEGRFFFSIAGAVAELEKEKIADRTARGRRGKLKTGRLPGNVDVFGYSFNTTTDLLDIDDIEAEWVRRIYNWSVSEGLGPYEVRDRLNDLGVRAPRGPMWHVATIKRILSNPTYLGKLTLNRRDWTGYSLNKHRPKNEKVDPVWRAQSEWVVIDVPAIIDSATWSLAQDALNRKKGIKPKTARLLSGLMICGLCGGRLHYKPHYKRANGPVYYYIFCEHKFASYARGKKAPAPLCALKTIPARRLEEFVISKIDSWIWQDGALEEARQFYTVARTEAAPLREELAAVERHLAEVEAEHGRLVSLVRKGLANEETEAPQLSELMSTIRRLSDRRADLQRRVAVTPDATPQLDMQEFRRVLGARVADKSPDDQAWLVRRMVKNVKVGGPNPEDWSFDLY